MAWFTRSDNEIRDVIKNNVTFDDNNCWNWNKTLRSDGYALFWYEGKSQPGHRVSYKVFKGKIIKGLFVCHSCDNRKCLNPDHLWLGTHLQNLKDMHMKKRHCIGSKNNHSKLTEEQVISMRYLYNKLFIPSWVLLEFYKISYSTFKRILNRKYWNHI